MKNRKVRPLILAATPDVARKYATRHRLGQWDWPRYPEDFHPSRHLILLPGWQTHRLASWAESVFTQSLRPSGTEIAKRAVSR